MSRDREYHQTETVSLGENQLFASDTTQIGLGTEDGQIELLDVGGRESIRTDAPLADITLDKYVVSLSGETVRSYTDSGVELWSRTVADAAQVVSFGGQEVLAVLSGDGRIVGLDLETGNRLFERGRPHDEFGDIHIVGGNGRLCLAAWSFVTCLDPSGEVTVDLNLQGTIKNVAILGELVIVLRKDGKIVAVDPETGNSRWNHAAAVSTIAPRGVEWLPVITDSGAGVLHEEGRIEDLDIDAERRIISSGDGAVLATVEETSAHVYHQGPSAVDQLALEVLTDQVDSETTIRVAITNTGTQQVETTVALDCSPPLTLDSDHQRVELETGERAEVGYRVSEPAQTDVLECQFSADGEELVSETLQVVRQVDPDEAVELSTELQEIAGDTVRIDCEVENTSETTIDAIEIGTEKRITSLQPEGSETVEIGYPLDGSNRMIEATVHQGGTTATVTSHVAVPDRAIEAEIARVDEQPAVDLQLRPSTEAATSGPIQISIDGDTAVGRQIELDPHKRLTVMIVFTHRFDARDEVPIAISSPLLKTDRAELIDGWDQPRQELPAGGPEKRAAGDVEDIKSVGNTEQESLLDDPPGSAPRPTDREREPGERMAPIPAETPPLEIERELPDAVERGELFDERVQITNHGSAPLQELHVPQSGGSYVVDALGPGETVTVQRKHAVFATQQRHFPPIEVHCRESDGGRVQIKPSDIEARVQAQIVEDADEFVVRATVENNTAVSCTVARVGINVTINDDTIVWRPTGSENIAAAESRTTRRVFEIPPDETIEERNREALVEYELANGERKQYRTLASLEVDPLETDSLFRTRLLERSRFVAGTQGVIELAIENASGRKATDLTLSIAGNAVVQTPMSPDEKQVPQLSPSSTTTMLADIRPESAGEMCFECVVTGTIQGEQVTRHIEFCGPVAPSTEEWNDKEYLDRWERRDGDDGPDTVTFAEPHIVTSFRPMAEGSRR